MLRLTDAGLYCEAGDFHVDPWLPVPRAVITHAHGDHARPGSDVYLAAAQGAGVLRTRLGPDASIRTIAFGETIERNGVRISLHPAGHILGSAQVRIEQRGEVWVVSGDYKSDFDPTCMRFEPVRCDTFITESTFGLPIYRWPPQETVFAQMRAWWAANAEAGRASIVYAYALGKAQRILAGLIDADIGPVFTHGAVERLNDDYRAAGVALPATRIATSGKKGDFARALIVAPPSAMGSTWLRRFGPASDAFVSGWMQIRGTRRRRSMDRGFVLSDHVDWPALLATIEATGAARVWVTHGYREPLVRWLRERGMEAEAVMSRWEGEVDDEGTEPMSASASGIAGAEERHEADAGSSSYSDADTDADRSARRDDARDDHRASHPDGNFS